MALGGLGPALPLSGLLSASHPRRSAACPMGIRAGAGTLPAGKKRRRHGRYVHRLPSTARTASPWKPPWMPPWRRRSGSTRCSPTTGRRANGAWSTGPPPAKPVKVSAELFGLLAACLDYSRESEGAFDITVGPLMKTWGFYKSSGHLAPQAEVAAALSKIGYRHVHLDAAAQTVWFDTPAWRWTPAGSAKATPWIAWWRS
jgi:hypothetical protein